jgi:hypothetical protein
MMMTASCCDCLFCRLEATLIAELSDDRNNEEFRSFALSSPILCLFPTASELIRNFTTTGMTSRIRHPMKSEWSLLVNAVMPLKNQARIRLTISQQENKICPKPDTNDRTALSSLAESHGRCRRRPAAGRNGASLFLR